MLGKRYCQSLAITLMHHAIGLCFFLFNAVVYAACVNVGSPMKIDLGEIEDKPLPPGDQMVLLKTITFPASVYAQCDGVNQKDLRWRIYSSFSDGVVQSYSDQFAIRITLDQSPKLKALQPYYFEITENDRELKLGGGTIEIFKIFPGSFSGKMSDFEQMILIEYEGNNGRWINMREYQVVGGRVLASRCKLASFQKTVDLGDVPIQELDDPNARFVPFSLDFNGCPTGLTIKLTMSGNAAPNHILLNQMSESKKIAAQNVGVQITDDSGVVPINIPQPIRIDNPQQSLLKNYFARLRKVDAGATASSGGVQSQVTLNLEYQ